MQNLNLLDWEVQAERSSILVRQRKPTLSEDLDSVAENMQLA